MKFKPGDVIVHYIDQKYSYLVFKIDHEKTWFIILSCREKSYFGNKSYLYTDELKLYTLLQETKLNEF